MANASAQRTMSVARKELLHILRDPQTLFFTLFMPVLELFMLGYAIDTNVRDVRTLIVDQSGTQESRALIEKFENSHDFKVVARAYSEAEATKAIVAGKVRVAIIIPADYSRKLQANDTAQILILVDGTESSIASAVVNVGNSLALRESLEKALGDKPLPVEARPRILFNPDTRSANFFIPGLMVIMCQIMATVLAANSIVREKELGTLEQLYMSPVRRGELIIGKMLPYVVLSTIEFCFLALLMRLFFDVPINGSFTILLMLTLPFVLTMLGIGLLISSKAETRDATSQMAMGTVLPSIFLSGYVFPLDSMPEPFVFLSNFIPTTWLIDASRAVILRGAGMSDLVQHTVVLWSMAIAMIVISSLRLRKQM